VLEVDGTLVGIVTEGDLLRRPEISTEKHRPRWLTLLLGPGRAAEEFARIHGRRVEEVMTPTPYSITEDVDLEQAVTLMEGHNIKRLPVLRNSKLVGILSRANVLRALLKTAKFEAPVVVRDQKIREAILAQMEKTSWAPTAMVDLHVENGAVTLSGTLFDDRDRSALVVLAENTPGVTKVCDRLIWVEPLSGLTVGPPKKVEAA
jgi:CBS-domain-containing membrane protein